MALFCPASDDDGWRVVSRVRAFDLSLCFQYGVFGLVPLAFLLLFWLVFPRVLFPRQVSQLSELRSRLELRWVVKLVFGLVLVSVRVYFVVVALSLSESADVCGSRSLGAIGRLVGDLLALWAIDFYQRFNRSSSGVLIVYWIVGAVIDGLLMRSLLMVSTGSPLILCLPICAYALLILIENFPSPASSGPVGDGYHQVAAESSVCPEETSPFSSRVSFAWLNPLMRLGYRKTLVADDLFELDRENRTDNLASQFQFYWNQELDKDRPSLLRALVKAFGGVFVFAAFFKLGQDILQFIQPVLLGKLIAFIESRNPLGTVPVEPQPAFVGFSLAGFMFLAAVTQSLLLHQYFHRCIITGMRIRSALVTAVYSKSMRLSNGSRQRKTTGEIVNLMSVDSQRFMELCTYLHIVWSGPVQISIALYLLYQTLGPSIFAGLGVMILMIPVNGVTAVYMQRLQKKQMTNKDNRMKAMDEILNGIKVIKLFAWESIFVRKVGVVRGAEMATLKKSGLLGAVQTFTWACTPVLVSFATFATYSLVSNDALDPEKVFVSISLFNLLQFPLAILPYTISGVVETSVSMNRLHDFLTSEELDPRAVLMNSSTDIGESSKPAIKIVQSSFRWSNDGEDILHNMAFTLPKRSLVAIIGKVGSGKSSLLSAILGEMYWTRNDKSSDAPVTINGSIAYVGQQAWIMNVSLRENILFGASFEEARYKRVVEACGLAPDVSVLPAGDLTEIGERGINLSGGQKQRVSIARAVYANKDIYIFDDALSAVDAHVGRHIFDHVIGPRGLLKDKTRLLITHALQYLPDCDLVGVLADGAMIEQPTSFKDLMSRSVGLMKSLMEELNHEDDNDPKSPLSLQSTLGSPDQDNDETPLIKKNAQVSQQNLYASASSKDDGGKLTTAETSARGSVEWSVYVSYARACSYTSAIVAIVFMILGQTASIMINVWLKYWGTQSAQGNGDNLLLYLGVYGLLGLSFAALIVTCTLIVRVVCAINASKSLHNDMVNSVTRLPMSFFDTTPIGRVVNRFAKDINTVDELLPQSFQSFFRTLFQVVAIFCVISISTPLFIVLIVPMSLLYYRVQRYYLSSSRELKRLDSVTKSPIFANFSETLGGVSTIRAYGQRVRFERENADRVDLNVKCYYPSVASNRWLAIRLEFLGAIVIFGAALFAVIGVLYFKNVDAGIVGLSVSYALTVTQTLNWMVRQSCEIETNIVSVERIKEYIDLPPEAPLSIDNGQLRSSWPEYGEVEFRNYAARYREDLDFVLRGINVKIQAGEKVGVVGRSGAGKSSLMLAIFRLIEPASGTILIDGTDICKIGLRDLRSHVTIIPQDPVLFAGSVRSNLDPTGEHADADLWAALDSAELTEKVQSLEGKLDGEIIQGGENFSVGQRQLICLARAIVRQSKVLVLDEATAAIDVETDFIIQKTIRKEFQHCTVLTIAHRINTVMDSDKIIVMDAGVIAECDFPATLLANRNSMFFSLAKEAGQAS
eukprot:Partr_v1_DN28105_c1_g1_i1_m55327 putative ATP-binding cassette, sub-family C (CFTR MRP), member